MSYSHGVYTSEQATSLTTPIEGSAGLQVIFGTAPIHLADDPYNVTNVPKLCYSYAEAALALGYSDDFDSFTLCQSIDANFRVFNNAPIILVNVLDPKKTAHITTNAAASYDVADDQVAYGETMVLLDTIVVKNGDTTLVAGTDYLATHEDDDTVLITLLSSGAQSASSLTISSTSLNPAGVTTTDVVGGVDSTTGAETGLELIRQIYPTLGLVPGLLLAPGWSHNAVVAAALQAKTENINGVFNCSCLLDLSTESGGATVYTDVLTAKTALGANSTRAIVLWPKVAIDDKAYYYSAMFGALVAYTDANNDDVPYMSPSNKAMSITSTVLEDGTTVVLDQEQGNLLNGYGVVTAININGFRSWGNNTACYPSNSDVKDRWIPVRRFFDWDKNNFILTYFQKVDDPCNSRLIQSIVDSRNILGNGFVARGYCAGYYIAYLESENTVTELLDGKLSLHVSLAPYVPAQTIDATYEYDVEALTSALGGE